MRLGYEDRRKNLPHREFASIHDQLVYERVRLLTANAQRLIHKLPSWPKRHRQPPLVVDRLLQEALRCYGDSWPEREIWRFLARERNTS